jgi:hypothetical protein
VHFANNRAQQRRWPHQQRGYRQGPVRSGVAPLVVPVTVRTAAEPQRVGKTEACVAAGCLLAVLLVAHHTNYTSIHSVQRGRTTRRIHNNSKDRRRSRVSEEKSSETPGHARMLAELEMKPVDLAKSYPRMLRTTCHRSAGRGPRTSERRRHSRLRLAGGRTWRRVTVDGMVQQTCCYDWLRSSLYASL